MSFGRLRWIQMIQLIQIQWAQVSSDSGWFRRFKWFRWFGGLERVCEAKEIQTRRLQRTLGIWTRRSQVYQEDSENSFLADSNDLGELDAGFKGFIGFRPGGLIWLRGGSDFIRCGCRCFTIFSFVFVMLGIQTRRILGIHCDSDDLIYLAHWFFFVHDDLVYLRLRDLMGFRDCQTNVIAHKIAGSL